ncbi:MAG: hypothetical protein L6V81_07105 [Clostridium sp.]|nr:MAG: hypothetical protein L6V81_07105 [Clostridium sp.]
MDDKVYVLNNDSLDLINNSNKLKEVIGDLLVIAYNDEHISNERIEKYKE